MSRYALRLSLLLLVAATAGACSATVHQPIRVGPAPVVFATRPLAAFDRGLPLAATPTLPILARDIAVNDFADVPSVPLIPSVSVETLFRETDAQYRIPRVRVAATACTHDATLASTEVYASTLASSDVQSAINAAPAGSTVCLPAGTGTWTTAGVSWSNKRLTITGAGIDLTTLINNQNSSSAPFIQADTCSASNFVTISGLSMKTQSASNRYGFININCNNVAGYPAVSFRIHHVKMYGEPLDGTTNCNGCRFIGVTAYGLVDHSVFTGTTGNTAGGISFLQDNGFSTANSYHVPLSFGDANALYIEDCDFYSGVANSGNGVTDNYTGGRWVVRFSRIKNNNVGVHGPDSGPRGAPTFEVYGNDFIAESHIGGIDLFGPRSGTGFVWGNHADNIQPMSASEGYISLFTPRYYGAISPARLQGNADLNFRFIPYYPSGTWGTIPYPGTTTTDDGKGNLVSGSNKIDGNQKAAGHMDPDFTRTVTDLVTTAGSKTITSATASFVAGDLLKRIYGTNIVAGRVLTDGVCSNGSTTVTSATANFVAGDVGRIIGGNVDINSQAIPDSTTITVVTNSTTVTISQASTDTCGILMLLDCYLTTINSPSSADMTCKAAGSGTGGTLSIGHTDEGYPLEDQPGRGPFPSANAGLWPTQSSYTEANYEALTPTYLFQNLWQDTDAALTPSSSRAPVAPGEIYVGLEGGEGYIKANRDWYNEDAVNCVAGGGCTVGVGMGATLPTTCTAGTGFWKTNEGNWNQSLSNPYGVNVAGADGVFYKCTATNTWTAYYTPYTYPHPLQS